MGILLLFYHAILEKEKMHQINRGYLIFSLVFSLSIPLIPVGMSDAFIPWFQNQQFSEIQYLSQGEWLKTGPEERMSASESSGTSLYSLAQIAFLVYAMVAGVLFVRLIRIVHMIQLKADRNPRKLFDDYEIVLLGEKVVPHTFYSTIFLNKDQYLKGEIAREIMVHELTHARQKHTLDILFVEILKIVFWFNPVLYFYKKAMLLNHEFLADEAVIRGETQVSKYQKLLLNSLMEQPSPGPISRFNYSLTKKRFHMMLQTKSKVRTFLKITFIIPIFISLALLFGCKPTPSEYSKQESNVDELTIEIYDPETLKINGDEMKFSEFEKVLSNLPENLNQVTVEVHSNATIGIVSDVQQLLRSHKTLKINYHSNQERNDEKLKLVTQKFLNAANEYMNMSILDTNPDILQKEYDELLILYEAIKNVGIRIPDSPPPPPLVPSPEERIKNLDLGGSIEIPESPTPNPPPAIAEPQD
jgi:biopolymer transport protein ExbD